MNETEIIVKPGQPDYLIKRTFSAPLSPVFRAFTEPELLSQWFMPKEAHLQIIRMDCKEGGSFHFTQIGPGGGLYGFKGVYHEVSPEAGIIKTSEFLGLPQRILPLLEITTFEAAGNETHVTIHSICPDNAYRDSMISAGMKPTLDHTHELLDNLLKQI